jgi:hypothetical protein
VIIVTIATKREEFKIEELIMKNKFHVFGCYVEEVYMIYTNGM